MAELQFDTPRTLTPSDGPWYREMTRYCWFVLVVAAMGWLFDCLDQHLFNLARRPAMEELLKGTDANPTAYGYYVTGIFLLGWGTGGLIFGALGDKLGRAKTMILCILVYSACTGLSALSHGFWDFSLYRFMTGLGVGGEFAVGVALVAETVPSSARAGALGLLQALSTVGNVSAAFIGLALGFFEVQNAWRWMFVVGALPAAMVILVQRKVREPEIWVRAKAEGRIATSVLGSLASLFSNRVWRKNAIIGLTLGCAGIVGFWGIGVFSNDLVRTVLKAHLLEQSLETKAIDSQLNIWVAINTLMMNVGGFTGMMLYARMARVLGRRPTFAMAFVLAFLATVLLFQGMTSHWQVFWLTPIMGFCQLGIFALYAIYFPELFPTSLRSTGTSFCYNFGRFVAAGGTVIQGYFATQLSSNSIETLRSIGTWTAAVYLVGIFVLPFAPETKGKPLPE
jgi:MFS family permease